jgi:hypothetical protein
MANFLVEQLSADRIPLAFPLIRQVAPSLDLPRWARFARQLVRSRAGAKGGILVVRRPAMPYPCGMVCYRRDDDPAHTAVLTAEYLVAMDIVDPSGALDALVDRLEEMARELGCGAVRSLMHAGSPQATSELLAAGHARGGTLMLKVLQDQPEKSPSRCH